MFINGITDRYHQWPLTTPQYLAFLNDKYDNPDATHHYEIAQTSGDTTIKINIGKDNTDFPSATAISNVEYEDDRQDKQRSIRLLDPTYLEQFIEEFEELMDESAI